MLKKYITRFSSRFRSDEIELVTNASNYLIGDVISRGMVFLTIPIYTRLLPPDQLGILAVFQSIIYMLSIVYSCGVPGAVTRYYYEERSDFKSFFGNNVFFTVVLSLIFSLIVFILRRPLAIFFNINTNLIIYVILISLGLAVFRIYKAYLQAIKYSKKYSILSIGKESLILIISIPLILLLSKNEYMGKVYSQSIVILGLFVFLIFSIYSFARISLEKKHFRYSLIFGLPVVVHLLSHYLLTSFDQIIINQLLGKTETGLYFVAYRIGLIQNILNLAIIKAWTPLFYEKLNKELYEDITRLVQKYALIIFASSAVLILFSREIMALISDVKYHQAAPIIPIIITSYIFVFIYTIYVNYSFYYKKTYLISMATILCGLLNIGLNYLLIPKFGYFAAAFTTLISYCLLFVLHYFNVRYILKIENRVSFWKIVKFSFLPLIGLVIFTVGLIYDLNLTVMLPLKGLSFIIVLLVIYLFFKRQSKNNSQSL